MLYNNVGIDFCSSVEPYEIVGKTHESRTGCSTEYIKSEWICIWILRQNIQGYI